MRNRFKKTYYVNARMLYVQTFFIYVTGIDETIRRIFPHTKKKYWVSHRLSTLSILRPTFHIGNNVFHIIFFATISNSIKIE